MKSFIIVGAFFQVATEQAPHSGVCGALYAPVITKEIPSPFFGTIIGDATGFTGETYDEDGHAVISGVIKNDTLSFKKKYDKHPDKISFDLLEDGHDFIGIFRAENDGQKSHGRARCRLIPVEEDFFKL